MSELPKGWVETTLDELSAYIQRGKSPKYADKSDLPVVNQKCVRWNGLDRNYVKYIHPDQFEKWDAVRYLTYGDILWNSTGTGTIGRATFFIPATKSEKLVVDSHVTIVRPSNLVNPKYVYYWIKSPAIQKKMEDMQSGSTNQVELSKTAVCSTRIPLCPKNEQDRIVAKLDSVFSELNETKTRLNRVPELLKKFRQSVLDAACTGKLTEDWRKSNAKSGSAIDLLRAIDKEKDKLIKQRKIKKSKVLNKVEHDEMPFALPSSWAWTRFGELISRGPTNGIYLPQAKYGDGFPILRIDDFQVDWCKKSCELRKVRANQEEINRYCLELNDIVINRVNSISHLGKSTVIKEENVPALFESNMMSIKVFSEINPDFIAFWLQSSFGRYFLIKDAKHAVNQASINQTDVCRTITPLPPRLEQIEIVKRVKYLLNQTAKIVDTYEAAKSKIEKTEPSILKLAFEGRLVEQDSNDEPASVLLERIKSERKTTKKKIIKGTGSKKKKSKSTSTTSNGDSSSGVSALAAKSR